MKNDAPLYLDLMKRILTNSIYRGAPIAWFEGNPGFAVSYSSDWERTARWPNVAHTMVGVERLDNVQECLEQVIEDDVPGDFIETGAWRGGVCIFARAILRAHGVRDRKVWVADSFEGVPSAGAGSHPLDVELGLHDKNDVLAVSEECVRENFRRYDLLDDQVGFLGGWFSETLPSAPLDRLAVIRLDGDLHRSTTDALVHLYPRLSPGGFLIVDDYGIPACAAAVHEFRDRNRITDPIRFIDPYSIYWRRTG